VALIGLGISAACVVFVLSSVDLGAAIEVLRQADITMLLIGCAFFLGCVALRSFTWLVLLPPRPDGSRIPLPRVVPLVFIGLLGNTVLPARLGEVIRAYLVTQRERVSLGGALGSILLERIVDTSTLAVMAFGSALLLGVSGWVLTGTGILAAAGVAILVVLLTVGFRPLLSALRAIARIEVLRRGVLAILANLEEFVHWSGGTHRRASVAAAMAISVGLWSCSAAMFLFVSRSLGVDLNVTSAVLVMAVTVLATAIPSAPAYVGTYELAAVAVLTSIGVSPDAALAIAVVTHVISLVPTLVGGAASLAILGIDLGNTAASAVDERARQAVGDGPA
jgi:uncharacterized protein (TIRG00374 family)